MIGKGTVVVTVSWGRAILHDTGFVVGAELYLGALGVFSLTFV